MERSKTANNLVRSVALAGLTPDLEDRVKSACEAIATRGIDVRITPWMGARGHMLVANLDDRFGEHARELAQRRNLPVLSFSSTDAQGDSAPGAPVLASSADTEQIAQVVYGLLNQTRQALRAGVAVTKLKTNTAPGFLRLLDDSALSQGTLHATSSPYQVWVLQSSSFIAAHSHSDLLAARERILDDSWTFRAVRDANVPDTARMSLDAFFLDAYSRVAERLPPFPAGMYKLRCWPDLGLLSHMPETMQLASALNRVALSATELAAQAKVTVAQANTFLWAMRSSGLLESAGGQTAAATLADKPRVRASLLRRLAHRFGVSLR